MSLPAFEIGVGDGTGRSQEALFADMVCAGYHCLSPPGPVVKGAAIRYSAPAPTPESHPDNVLPYTYANRYSIQPHPAPTVSLSQFMSAAFSGRLPFCHVTSCLHVGSNCLLQCNGDLTFTGKTSHCERAHIAPTTRQASGFQGASLRMLTRGVAPRLRQAFMVVLSVCSVM